MLLCNILVKRYLFFVNIPHLNVNVCISSPNAQKAYKIVNDCFTCTLKGKNSFISICIHYCCIHNAFFRIRINRAYPRKPNKSVNLIYR